jgi:hypothetical protein
MSSRTAIMAVVLTASLPLPIQAHDIYSHLLDEVGASCCDDRDCRPALYRVTASGVQMFVDQRWIDVPNERIQYRALPGDTGETRGGHWCGSTHEPDFSKFGALYMTKCAVLPPQSASVQVDLPKFAEGGLWNGGSEPLGDQGL